MESTEFCPEHTQMREDLGAIKAGIESLKTGQTETNQKLDQTARDLFARVNQHIDDAPDWHARIIQLETLDKGREKESKIKQTDDDRHWRRRMDHWGLMLAGITVLINLISRVWLK